MLTLTSNKAVVFSVGLAIELSGVCTDVNKNAVHTVHGLKLTFGLTKGRVLTELEDKARRNSRVHGGEQPVSVWRVDVKDKTLLGAFTLSNNQWHPLYKANVIPIEEVGNITRSRLIDLVKPASNSITSTVKIDVKDTNLIHKMPWVGSDAHFLNEWKLHATYYYMFSIAGGAQGDFEFYGIYEYLGLDTYKRGESSYEQSDFIFRRVIVDERKVGEQKLLTPVIRTCNREWVNKN